MRKKHIFIVFFTAALLILAGCADGSVEKDSKWTGTEVTVFKSPSCGCCVGYSSFLEDQGFEVEVVPIDDMRQIKERYGIPRSMESCHTAVVGDYFVEGHVPISAVEKLLDERPDIDGIAMPGMPSGSPGMPGMKRGAFQVYSLDKGEVSEFVLI